MTPLTLVLSRAERRLIDRLEQLESQLDAGENVWTEYLATITALATLPARGDRVGELLTTKELAARLSVSPKTLLRRKKANQIAPALQLGKRGRAALRWKAQA